MPAIRVRYSGRRVGWSIMCSLVFCIVISGPGFLAGKATALLSEASESPADNSIVTFLQRYVSIIAGIAEVGVVILLYKTVKDFAELAKVSKLQTEVRFRPWIGPTGTIARLGEDDKMNTYKYAIALKNFGEVPSSSVTGSSFISKSLPTRKDLSTNNNNKFDLGPLLPNMEKRYWIFLDKKMVAEASTGASNIFVALYFSYQNGSTPSGYGMISQYDPKSDGFVHKEMWLD